MKTKIEDLKVADSDKALIKACLKTRSLPALATLIKMAIFRRDQLLGKENVVLPKSDLDSVSDTKSRKRSQSLVNDVLNIEDRKTLSYLCAGLIAQRKACRVKAQDDVPVAQDDVPAE